MYFRDSGLLHARFDAGLAIGIVMLLLAALDLIDWLTRGGTTIRMVFPHPRTATT